MTLRFELCFDTLLYGAELEADRCYTPGPRENLRPHRGRRDRVWKSSTCARGALRPARRHTARAKRRGAGLPTASYSSEPSANGPVRLAPPAGSRPGCRQWIGVPKSCARRSPPQAGLPTRAPEPARARRPTHRSRAPAPPSPGAGGPCGCRMPSGRARRAAGRWPSAGASSSGGLGGGGGGGGGAPLCQLRLRRAPSPGEVWRSKGWRRGGGGAASPPCPALPRSPTFPTGERPPPAGHGSGSNADALPPGTGPQEGGQTGGEGARRPLPSTGLTEPEPCLFHQICLKGLRARAATPTRPQPLWEAGSLSEEH